MTVFRGLMGVFLVVAGLWSSPSQADEGVVVALSYFDNNSNDAKYDNLQKGITDMLITKLAVPDGVRIVERDRLESVLKEIELGKGPFIDPKTAQRMGQGLGAELIVTGAFMVIDGKYQADARVIMVGSSEVMTTAVVSGELGQFFDLQTQLAETLLTNIGAELAPLKRVKVKRSPTKDFAAFTHFSDGLAASDKGDKAGAKKAFSAALKSDPAFKAAEERLSALEERVTRLEQSGGLVLSPKTAMDHYFNSRVHSKRGNLTEALSALTQALNMKADAVDALVDYAKTQRAIDPTADLKTGLQGFLGKQADGFTVALLLALSDTKDAPLSIVPDRQSTKLSLADFLIVQLSAGSPDRPTSVEFKRAELAAIRRLKLAEKEGWSKNFLDESQMAETRKQLEARLKFYGQWVSGHGAVSTTLGRVVINGAALDPNLSEDTNLYDLLAVAEPNVRWAKLTFEDGTACEYQDGKPSSKEGLKSQVTFLRAFCRSPRGFSKAKLEILGWGSGSTPRQMGEMNVTHAGINLFKRREYMARLHSSFENLRWSFSGDFGSKRFSHQQPVGMRVVSEQFGGSEFVTEELPKGWRSAHNRNGGGRSALSFLPDTGKTIALPSRWMGGVGIVSAANAHVITPIYYWLPKDTVDVPHGLHSYILAHPEGKSHSPLMVQDWTSRAWTAMMALMAGQDTVAAATLDHALDGRGELYRWFWLNSPPHETEREVAAMLYSSSRGSGAKSKVVKSLMADLDRDAYPFFAATVDYADGRLSWDEYRAKARECGEQQEKYTPAYFEGQAVINAILKDKNWASNPAIAAQVERSLAELDVAKFSNQWWWNWLRAATARHRAKTLSSVVEIPSYRGQIDSTSVWNSEKYAHPGLLRALTPDQTEPARKVSVGSFWLDRTEVKAADFRACVAAGVCSTERKFMEKETCEYSDVQRSAVCRDGVDPKRPFPAADVSQDAAATYCKWRGGRLPTLDEWQVAARAGMSKPPEGVTTSHWVARTDNFIDQVSCRILGPRWAEGARPCSGDVSKLGPWDGHAGLAPVGAHPLGATPEGVEGLLGNLSEWVDDDVDGPAAAGCNFAMPGSASGVPCERALVRFKKESEISTRDKLRNRDRELAKLVKASAKLTEKAEEVKAQEDKLKAIEKEKSKAKNPARKVSMAATKKVRLLARDLKKAAPEKKAEMEASLAAAKEEEATAKAAYKAATEAAKAARSEYNAARRANSELRKNKKAADKELSAFRRKWSTDEELVIGELVGFRCAYDRKPKH